MRIGISVRHDYDEGAARIAIIPSQLEQGLYEGVTRFTRTILHPALVEKVVQRTGMSPAIAEKITTSSTTRIAKGARGRVSFTAPGSDKYPIVPKEKKALFWPGARHPVARVMHPRTRPWALIPRAVQANEGSYERVLADEVRSKVD